MSLALSWRPRRLGGPSPLAYAERALGPLDALRSATLRAVGRRGRVLFASRDARVLVYAAVSTAVTLALAIASPRWLLVVGPLVLGVPHLVADVRYLVARPGLHRRRGLAVLVGVPLAATWIWPSAALALASLVAVAIAARGAWPRRALLVAIGAGAVVAARHFGGAADLVIAHAHNAVALVVWWVIARRARVHLVPIALVVAGVAIVLCAPIAEDHSARMAEFSRSLGGFRWALVFAFMQATHYAVWLRLVPEDARDRGGIRSFASTLRALVRDCGGWLVGAAALGALAVAVYGVVDAHAARLSYLRFAFFHGFLELAVLGLAFVEGAHVLRAQRESRP